MTNKQQYNLVRPLRGSLRGLRGSRLRGPFAAFAAFVVCSFIILQLSGFAKSEDLNTYDPKKGKWVTQEQQCKIPGEPNEPRYGAYYVRIDKEYKQYQWFQTAYIKSGGYYKSKDYCQDGSVVPETAFENPGCLQGFSTTECMSFPIPINNYTGEPYEGQFPIFWTCYYNSERGGWAYAVKAYCTKNLILKKWIINGEEDLCKECNRGTHCEYCE